MLALAVLLAWSGAALATTTLSLPASNEMTTSLFGDFLVYSLELNALCGAAGDPRCLPFIASQYPVQSSPGQINNEIVIYQGSNGNNNLGGDPLANGSPADNPFRSPAGGVTSFAMSSTNEPGSGGTVNAAAEFTGDLIGRWDIKVSTLLAYLTNPLTGKVHDLVFLFDNNQTGTALGQALTAWGQIRINNSTGVLQNNWCFELRGDGLGGCSDTGANPAPASSLFVPAVGDFCVNSVTGAAYAAGKSDCENAGDYFITNNLGQNSAEFAIFNGLLNSIVHNAANGDLFLSLNMKLDLLTDGDEQLWICSRCDVAGVPEPGLLIVFGAGLVGLGAYAWWRRKA